MAWEVTIRIGPAVTRHRAEDAEDAVALLERELTSADARRDEQRALTRSYRPQEQVAARGEVRGPGAPWSRRRGGVDIRGDGSAEAFTGRVSRRPVEPHAEETAFAALRRALS